MSTNRHPLAVAACVALLPACGGSPPPAAPAAPAGPTYDVQAIMEGMASTLLVEQEILVTALRSMDEIDEEDRRALADALDERARLAGEFEAMLRANPTWTPTACEWYDTVVRMPHFEVVDLRLQLTDLRDAPTRRSRYLQLLVEATGSTDAAREVLRFNTEHPGSPANAYIMCLKFGHIEER